MSFCEMSDWTKCSLTRSKTAAVIRSRRRDGGFFKALTPWIPTWTRFNTGRDDPKEQSSCSVTGKGMWILNLVQKVSNFLMVVLYALRVDAARPS